MDWCYYLLLFLSYAYCPLGGAHLLMDPFSVIDIMNNVSGGQTPPNIDKTSEGEDPGVGF